MITEKLLNKQLHSIFQEVSDYKKASLLANLIDRIFAKKEGATYYYVDSRGQVQKDEWHNTEKHQQRHQFGNVFPSHQLALQVAQYQKRINHACLYNNVKDLKIIKE